MVRVTSKLQLTVPKAIADRYGIKPGDDLDWVPAGDAIRVIPSSSRGRKRHGRTVAERLKLFDQATERQRQREAHPERIAQVLDRPWKPHEVERGWRREDLYDRGGPR